MWMALIIVVQLIVILLLAAFLLSAHARDGRVTTLQELLAPLFKEKTTWTNYQTERVYDAYDLNETRRSVL